ncbi:LolA-like protein [Granulicella arctica]|uniref:hypothetical protein n=1 Tax=Granulicella arctica TaxID=940613 RepID=UPI0021E0BA85|nr:hypothetical protein [Granulicella arctica]
MPAPHRKLLPLALAILAAPALAQQPEQPTAAAIMARVAANQDQAEAERSHYVYLQHAHVTSRKGNTVMCEETTDSRITPNATGSDEQLLKLDGRLRGKHGYIPFTTMRPAKHGDDKALHQDDKAAPTDHDKDDVNIDIGDDTDRDLVESMRSGLIHGKSKDGISAGLFPLTSKTQADYVYQLLRTEHLNGREVFHITFSPKDKDDYGWKGDAYIDTTAYQPVVVRTTMARKIPFAVRTLLGTNLPGLGFTVVYAPLPEGLWFPASFGTEFKLHLLFFYSRQIIIDAQNRDFEKTHVNSKIIPVT